MNADGMSKIISMMREQIETSSNFYVNKMKKLLQDQAKYILVSIIDKFVH